MNRAKINLYFFILTVLTVALSEGQNQLTKQPPEHIKTIIIRSKLTNNYTPMVRLGEAFTLEFDDLNSNQEAYTYKLSRYDYNWEPSVLSSTEFLNGYDNDYIRDFENSFNTFQPYTYYRLRIPNNNTQIKLSGNYLISVYDEDGELVFTRPFIIYKPLVDVGVTLHRSRDIATLNAKQGVQFSVNHPSLRINNPRQEIKIIVLQNNDWSTAIKDLKPQFIRGSQLLYKYIDKVSFWGGNEFLNFDTKRIRTASNRIARSELNDLFDTYLYTDEPRGRRPYTLNEDINGNFIIRTVDSEDARTEADYSWVHFTLDSQNSGDPIYIYGNFNGWQLTEENRMSYDENLKLFSKNILLKQGFYNYTYVKEGPLGKRDLHAIEGSFYETENEYTVIVYYRPIGSRYDQIIGLGSANSENLRN